MRDYVREVVLKLGSPQGGLMLESKLIDPAPLANLEALFATAAEMRTHYI